VVAWCGAYKKKNTNSTSSPSSNLFFPMLFSTNSLLFFHRYHLVLTSVSNCKTRGAGACSLLRRRLSHPRTTLAFRKWFVSLASGRCMLVFWNRGRFSLSLHIGSSRLNEVRFAVTLERRGKRWWRSTSPVSACSSLAIGRSSHRYAVPIVYSHNDYPIHSVFPGKPLIIV
jgi:hypothetical protein